MDTNAVLAASGDADGNLPSITNASPVLLVDNANSLAYSTQCLPKGWVCLHCDVGNIDAQSYIGFSHAVILGTKDEGGRAWAEAVARIITIPAHVMELPERLPEHWEISQSPNPGVVTKYLLEAAVKCKARIVPAPVNGNNHALSAIPPQAASYDPPQLICGGIDGRGRPKPIMANVVTILKTAKEFYNLRFDDFSQYPYVGDKRIEDSDILAITNWVQHQDVHASSSVVRESINHVATECRFNQVSEYLGHLAWDGVERLETLLIKHGGAADTPINRAFTLRWFISAVARAFEPGCQADCMLIIQGKQGLRKSSFFRAIGEPWFTGHLSQPIGCKDSRQELRGVWVVEVAELDGMRRADFNTIKAFITETKDRYRDSYGVHARDYNRTCVFGGTRNPDGTGWMPDETGGRRFWIMDVTKEIDIQAIRTLRDQLWAEAVAHYHGGEQWHLTTEEEACAEVIQEAAHERDVWFDIVAGYVLELNATTTSLVLINALKCDPSKLSKGDQMRVGKILSKLGFEGKDMWVNTGKGGRNVSGHCRIGLKDEEITTAVNSVRENLALRGW